MTSAAARARPECLRCGRPSAYCWCRELERVQTRTRLVFLQHPREAKVAIGTARMAHLGLPNSELHVGLSFEDAPRVQALVATPGTALLFPGEGARAPHELDAPPEHLVVVDGTWPQARKLLALNPSLLALPRVAFVPARPGNYRIRREPAAHCLATIEAVVEVLGALEGEPARFRPMLRAFEQMVDRQLAAVASREGAARHRAPREGPWWRNSPLVALSGHASCVVVSAEANVKPRADYSNVPPELVHLVAERVETGERFEAVLAPRQPLSVGTPFQLELEPDALLRGESVASFRARWDAFVREGDAFVSWGPFPRDLLGREAIALEPFYDLRILAALRLKRRPGSPADAAAALGLGALAWARGRAGRTLAPVAAITSAMLAEARRLLVAR